jgi:hypothetical protein
MNFEPITDYLLVSEVRGRWGLPPGSMMLHRAVIKDVLKVCMWLNGSFQVAVPEAAGTLVAVSDDGRPVGGQVNAWCYPVGKVQVDAFEFSYSYALDLTDGNPRYWRLPKPCLLSEMLEDGVVMLQDLAEAEAVLKPDGTEKWQAKSAATKEVGSMLRLISAMAADAYAYDPRQKTRQETIQCLQAASARDGEKPMHAQTIVKYLDRAISDYPPEYMKHSAPQVREMSSLQHS